MEFECTEENGKFIVKSFRTGKIYCIEAIGNPRTKWGDVDVATKKTTGSYGDKYRGSIDEKDSVITEENGFINIRLYDKGISPLAMVEKIDSKYGDQK